MWRNTLTCRHRIKTDMVMEIYLYLVLWPNLVLSKEPKNAIHWWKVCKYREGNSPQETTFGLLCQQPDLSYGVSTVLNHHVLSIDDPHNTFVGMPFIWTHLENNVPYLAVGDNVLLVTLSTAVSSSEDNIKSLSSPSELELIQYLLVSGPQQNCPLRGLLGLLHFCCKTELHWFCGFCVFLKLWHPVICLC